MRGIALSFAPFAEVEDVECSKNSGRVDNKVDSGDSSDVDSGSGGFDENIGGKVDNKNDGGDNSDVFSDDYNDCKDNRNRDNQYSEDLNGDDEEENDEKMEGELLHALTEVGAEEDDAQSQEGTSSIGSIASYDNELGEERPTYTW